MKRTLSIILTLGVAVLIFAAVAVVAGFHPLFAQVHGDAAPAVVILVCQNGEPDSPLVVASSESDATVILPAQYTGCARGLQSLYDQGFERQDYTAYLFQGSYDSRSWVLVRGYHGK